MKRVHTEPVYILSVLLVLSMIACQKTQSEQSPDKNIDSVATRLNDKAMKRYQNYMVADGENSLELEKSLDELDQAIKLRPQESLFYTNKANILLSLKKDSEALDTLHKLVEINPDFAEAFTIIGFIHERQDRPNDANHWYSKAMDTYERKIGQNQDVVTCRIGQAFLLFFTEGRESALNAYTKLKQEYPDSKEVLFTEQTFKSFNQDQFLQDFHL